MDIFQLLLLSCLNVDANVAFFILTIDREEHQKRFIKRAIEKGSEDNISCILIQVGNL